MPRKHTDMKTRFAVMKDLEAGLTIIADGKCNYIDGYSDILIAQKHGIKRSIVADLRLSMFGKLPLGTPPGTAPWNASFTSRFEAIERRLTEAEDYITRTLKAEHDKTKIVKSLQDIGQHMTPLTNTTPNGGTWTERMAAKKP